MRFCQGCLDKEAGHYALTARPTDMEDAVNKVRWFQHTNRVMYGKSRKEIKEVRYSFDSSGGGGRSSYESLQSLNKETARKPEKRYTREAERGEKCYISRSRKNPASSGEIRDRYKRSKRAIEYLT